MGYLYLLLQQFVLCAETAAAQCLLTYNYVISERECTSAAQRAVMTRSLPGGSAGRYTDRSHAGRCLLLGGRRDGTLCVYNWDSGTVDYLTEVTSTAVITTTTVISYQPAIERIHPLTHRPGALSLDPAGGLTLDVGTPALAMCPLNTPGAPPAAATWRRRCITLLWAYNEGSCMVCVFANVPLPFCEEVGQYSLSNHG